MTPQPLLRPLCRPSRLQVSPRAEGPDSRNRGVETTLTVGDRLHNSVLQQISFSKPHGAGEASKDLGYCLKRTSTAMSSPIYMAHLDGLTLYHSTHSYVCLFVLLQPMKRPARSFSHEKNRQTGAPTTTGQNRPLAYLGHLSETKLFQLL